MCQQPVKMEVDEKSKTSPDNDQRKPAMQKEDYQVKNEASAAESEVVTQEFIERPQSKGTFEDEKIMDTKKMKQIENMHDSMRQARRAAKKLTSKYLATISFGLLLCILLWSSGAAWDNRH